MNVRGTSVVVSLLVSILGCGTASTIATGSLSGTATYAGQSDHSGITVTAGGFSTTTDAAGNYALGALPVGSYSVLAIAPRSTERTMVVSATVNAGANTAPAMVFTPAQALAGQLSFMGTPLAGATVTLDGTGATTTTTTDANGVYSFANAEPGVHSLSFTSGPYSDQIPTVRYALDGGASVVAPFSGQVYAMLPFDLQGAPRATTVNIRVPARTLHYAPTLSADGALYFYGIGNDQGYASLYVGSTAGGPPVLVATDGYPTTSSKYQPKFSTGTTSTHLAYVRYNYTAGRYELCAVAIGAGPTAGPVKTLSTVSMRPDLGWEFSPQTTGPSPSIYFIEYDSATSVFTLRESNMDGGSVNSWDGVDSFYLSRKVRRVVFKQSLATLNRLVSVTATGASVGTSVIAYENWGATNTFTFYFHTFTPDETGFAYSITSAAVAGAPQLGLKRAQTGSVGALRVSATDLTPSPSCLAFNPAGTRIVWNRGGAGGLVTTSFDPVHIVSYVPNGTVTPTPATPTPPGSSCPTFTDDDRIWIAYNDGTQRLALAKADASAPPDVLDKDKTADLSSVFFGRAGAVYTRGSGNNLSFWGRSLSRPTTVESHRFDSATDYAYVVQFPASGIGALYRKRDYTQSQNNPYTLYWVGLGGADPVPVQIAALNSSSSSSSDGSKMLVSYYEEPAGGSFLTYAIVDMATGAKKILLRRGVNTAKLQDIGAAAVPKFIGFRNNSPMPYEHQDGVYIADP